MRLNALHERSSDDERGKAFLGRRRPRGAKPPSPEWVKTATVATSATRPARKQEPKAL